MYDHAMLGLSLRIAKDLTYSKGEILCHLFLHPTQYIAKIVVLGIIDSYKLNELKILREGITRKIKPSSYEL